MTKIVELDSRVARLKKDIEVVAEWRKLGKAFTKEQTVFAEQVVDRMLTMKMSKQMGVHLIEAENLSFLRKFDSRTQDVVANGSTKPKAERVSDGLNDVAAQVETAPAQPKKTPTAAEIKLKGPQNQKDGEVTSVATGKVPGKELTTDADADITNENIGHNPQLPMPQKSAEELVANVRWGIKVGVYRNEDEGIQAQLTRKDYTEFTDTDEKLKAVTAYIKGISANTTDPKVI